MHAPSDERRQEKAPTMNHYTVVIKWSDENGCFVVFLPEWKGLVLQPVTDGATYSEAAEHAHEVLEMPIEGQQEDGKPLPEPQTYEGVD
jgi:antitoxin HicB